MHVTCYAGCTQWNLEINNEKIKTAQKSNKYNK